METITSLQNPRVKNLLLLQQKSRERTKQNLVIVEGLRESHIALMAGYLLKEAYICLEISKPVSSLFPSDTTSFPLDTSLFPKEARIFEISRPVFEKIAYREGSDGFIALFEPRDLKLQNVKLKANPLVIILESVEKPGNLGAILRTADAANADAVIICDPLTDIYNPNVIRSSIGCVFSRQVVACSSEDAQQWLLQNNITSYAAELRASSHYYKHDYKGSVAFVMGTEADGLTDKWINFCNHRIIIPMLGSIDSLNVSVSTAILVSEAMRQRDWH